MPGSLLRRKPPHDERTCREARGGPGRGGRHPRGRVRPDRVPPHGDTRTSELVGAEAAGILLADHHGRLQLMASTDERTKMLELFQVQAQEGPCQDELHQGKAVDEADLSRDRPVAQVRPPCRRGRLQLGPRLPAATAQAGDRSPQPLQRHDRPHGRDRRAASCRRSPTSRPSDCSRNAPSAGASWSPNSCTAPSTAGSVIEQAKGALAQIHSISPDEAFELMRSYSRSHRRHLSEVAAQVTGDPSGVPGLTRRVESP